MATSLHKLIYPGKLHSLNEYIAACRRNAYQGAEMKRDDQMKIEWFIRSQLRGVRLKKPVVMRYEWYEPNRKRDLDNISSYGRKVIQYALVRCRVLENDNWNQIKGFSNHFFIDRKEPRIEVIIREEE